MEGGGRLQARLPGSGLGGGPATEFQGEKRLTLSLVNTKCDDVKVKKKTHMSVSWRLSGSSCAGIVDWAAAAAARKGAAKNVLEEGIGAPAAWRTGPPPAC